MSARAACVLAAVLLVGPAGSAVADGGAAADAQAPAKRKRAPKKPASPTASPTPSPKAAPAFTDDDLKKYSEERAGSGGTTSSAGAESSSGDPGASTASGSDPERDRRVTWETRAREARENVAEAKALVAGLEQKIEALRTDRGAANALDPFRLQTLQAEIQKATAELDAARERVRTMQAALDAVVEDARRQGVPAGWVREP
jgi:hypothetical protein